jgi:hypothetical protein
MLAFGFKKQKFYKRNFDSVGSANCAKSEIFGLMRKLFRGKLCGVVVIKSESYEKAKVILYANCTCILFLFYYI